MHTLQKGDHGIYLICTRGPHILETYEAKDQAEVDRKLRELKTDGWETEVYLAYKLVPTT